MRPNKAYIQLKPFVSNEKVSDQTKLSRFQGNSQKSTRYALFKRIEQIFMPTLRGVFNISWFMKNRELCKCSNSILRRRLPPNGLQSSNNGGVATNPSISSLVRSQLKVNDLHLSPYGVLRLRNQILFDRYPWLYQNSFPFSDLDLCMSKIILHLLNGFKKCLHSYNRLNNIINYQI